VNSPSFQLVSVHPETASFDPGLRFRFFAILGIARYTRRKSRALFGVVAKTLPEYIIGKPKATISERTLVNDKYPFLGYISKSC
jgi:hypothetical protein